LILRKTVATRCYISYTTKFDFGCGSAPDLAGGVYGASPDPLAGFMGPISRAVQRKGKVVRKGAPSF